MAYFQNPEVTLEVPDDWLDQTAVVYAERIARGLPATVSLVRVPISSADSLQLRVKAVLKKLVAELPDAKILEQNWLVINTVPAAQILVTWEHPSESMMQLYTLFVRDGTFWAFTATVPSARIASMDPILQGVIGSLKITKPQQPLELVVPRDV